jgi:hypothetical protein
MDGSATARSTSPWVNPLPGLVLSLGFAAAVALVFRVLWHPKPAFYAYNIPIAVPFAAFFLDRAGQRSRSGMMVDGAVLVLALLRVAAPPLPFASGHTLFAGYAALTGRGWVLRATAALVLLSVVYTKLFVTGGFWSMATGLALAAVLALVRRRLTATPGPLTAPGAG